MRMLGTDLYFSFHFLPEDSHILFSHFTVCMSMKYENTIKKNKTIPLFSPTGIWRTYKKKTMTSKCASSALASKYANLNYKSRR